MIRFGIAIVCIAIPLSALLLADCKWKPEEVESEPRSEGTVTDKGYFFYYQSGRRKADGYRLYRVRNDDKGLFTPTRWTDMDEVLIDCNLPDGRKHNPDWICVTKSPTADHKVVKQITELAYGANKDEFKQSPQAFVERQNEAGRTFPPLVTTITGRVAINKKQSVEIAFRVKSEVIARDSIIRYTFEALGDFTLRAVIVSSEKDKILDMADIALLWSSKLTRSLYDVGKMPVIDAQKKSYVAEVKLAVDQVPKLDRIALLTVLFKGDKIVATSASTYVALGDQR